MNTPLGWARANVIYDTMARPPRSGTLAEVLAIMVWRARVSQEVAGVRAQVQGALGGDAAVDAFSEFRDLVNRVEVKERSDKMRERLKNIEKVEAIRFKPLAPLMERSQSVRSVPREPLEDHLRATKLRPIKDFRPRRN